MGKQSTCDVCSILPLMTSVLWTIGKQCAWIWESPVRPYLVNAKHSAARCAVAWWSSPLPSASMSPEVSLSFGNAGGTRRARRSPMSLQTKTSPEKSPVATTVLASFAAQHKTSWPEIESVSISGHVT